MGGGDTPAAPKAPDYAAANREAISTDVSTLPTRRLIEQAASLGQLVNYTDPTTGQPASADFRGLGDAAAYQQLGKLAADYNSESQHQQLALRQELGVQNAEQTSKEIAATDPAAYATRQKLTEMVLGDLNQGGALDPQTSRQVTDGVRAGQAARGNYLGDAAAVQEAATMGAAAEQRRNQRLSAASALVLGAPITNQFGALQGAQQGAVGVAQPPANAGYTGVNPNAGAQGAAFAQQNYGTATNIWQTQANAAAQGPSWMPLAAAGAGAAATGLAVF